MTQKRFTLFDDGETIIDNEKAADDGGKQIYWTVEYVQRVKLVELLNELHEENQALKTDRVRYEEECRLDVFKELYEENEQLKFQLQNTSAQRDEFHRGARENANHIGELAKEVSALVDENEQLKQRLQKIQNSFEVNWTQNYVEFDKDELYIKDNNTEIRLNGTNLFIEVYIPQINEYYRFQYKVTGRSLMMKFIENYNSNGDNE